MQEREKLFAENELLRRELEEVRTAKERMSAEIAEKETEIESLKEELVLIHTGKSWKITRPLRKLKKVLK